jgi:hypothetical protein
MPAVLAFPTLAHLPKPRAAKARLRADVRANVQEGVELVHLIGEQNPNGLPPALGILRRLVPHPPPPGHEHDRREAADVSHAKIERRSRPRPATAQLDYFTSPDMANVLDAHAFAVGADPGDWLPRALAAVTAVRKCG